MYLIAPSIFLLTLTAPSLGQQCKRDGPQYGAYFYYKIIGKCPLRKGAYDCGKGTTVGISGSSITFRAGPQDSSVLIACGNSDTPYFFFCPHGQAGLFFQKECAQQLNSVESIIITES
ncbi:hypothetical protein FKW77_004874 [Venturia effusa]|uniref:Uncharacterized protein n=1 Tax=Venturia effusa TaxID=50376 RepID=A0A517LAW7_9PEZI|nr:hypothetical protein FKW77_004874 [Venturia effusa]